MNYWQLDFFSYWDSNGKSLNISNFHFHKYFPRDPVVDHVDPSPPSQAKVALLKLLKTQPIQIFIWVKKFSGLPHETGGKLKRCIFPQWILFIFSKYIAKLFGDFLPRLVCLFCVRARAICWEWWQEHGHGDASWAWMGMPASSDTSGGSVWYYMVYHGTVRYCMALHGIVWLKAVTPVMGLSLPMLCCLQHSTLHCVVVSLRHIQSLREASEVLSKSETPLMRWVMDVHACLSRWWQNEIFWAPFILNMQPKPSLQRKLRFSWRSVRALSKHNTLPIILPLYWEFFALNWT